jgi:hypothetical protein
MDYDIRGCDTNREGEGEGSSAAWQVNADELIRLRRSLAAQTVQTDVGTL